MIPSQETEKPIRRPYISTGGTDLRKDRTLGKGYQRQGEFNLPPMPSRNN